MGVGICRPPALRKFALLATALSLFGCAVASASVLAADAPASDVAYSVESAKASKSLMIDVVHAGKRLVAVGDRGTSCIPTTRARPGPRPMPTRQLLTAVFLSMTSTAGPSAMTRRSSPAATAAHLDQAVRRPQARSAAARCLVQGRQHGFAVGAYGALLETTDGGKHWQDVSERLDNPDQLHLNAIAAVKDAGLFIVGEQGSMFRSSDNGQTWEKVEGPTRARCSA
jgi:photosystem II stability/assembly factor-like uncharacterized protein